MCRHLAWLGGPRPLSDMIFGGTNALARQSWAPRRMRGSATLNADGWGVGWFAATDRADTPGERRVRSELPLWGDSQAAAWTPAVSSGAGLAAVRSATAGMPLTSTAVAPFGGPEGLFSLNGYITGWPSSITSLLDRVPPIELLTAEAPVDSALLWALVRTGLRSGDDAAEVVARTCVDVAAVAPDSRLNLLLHTGDRIVATTWGHSLWVRERTGDVLVSSEPLEEDDDGVGAHWQEIADGRLLVAQAAGVEIRPLRRLPHGGHPTGTAADAIQERA